MKEPDILNLHVLISHSFSCLNRDDLGMQKSGLMGGVRRTRISSQALKRAMRLSPYYRDHLGTPSFRSRNLTLITDHLQGQLADEFSEEVIRKTARLFVENASAPADADAEAEEEAEELEAGGAGEEEPPADDTGRAVAPWCVAEIRELCGRVAQVLDEGLTAEESEKIAARHAQLLEKYAKAKTKPAKPPKSLRALVEEELDKKIVRRLRGQMQGASQDFNQAVDIALSGRMATAGLMTSVYGAMAVAHAFTTHASEPDIDWFTAMDDLDRKGAGHISTQELSADVFYRYACISLGQLRDNLGAAPRTRALDVARHVAHLLATVTPSGKQQAFGAFNPAEVVLASFSDQPLSLANAFESPVKAKGEGFLRPSADRMLAYWDDVQVGYSRNDPMAVYSLVPLEGRTVLPRLDDLEQWIVRDGQC